MVCSKVLLLQGQSYPRTCAEHGLGPCPEVLPVPTQPTERRHTFLDRKGTMAKIAKMLERFDVRAHHRRLPGSSDSARRRWLREVAAVITDRKWRKVTDWNMDSSEPTELGQDSPPIADLREANIVTSEANGSPTGLLGALDTRNWHLPTLDIDVPMTVVPSTTHGHYHLYFDVRIEQDNYWRLLDAMAAAGIVQEAWVDASKNRGYSAVRMPWVPKVEPTE